MRTCLIYFPSNIQGETNETVGNILWLVLGGILGAIYYFIVAILCFVTIIFIPVGLLYLKVSKFFLWPMGKQVVDSKPSGFKTIVNLLWLIFFGWENFVGLVVIGCLFCITIIGIPFGKQYFKLAVFAALPLGHDFKAGTSEMEKKRK